MVPRLLAAARAMRSRTCGDVIQPCSRKLIFQAREELGATSNLVPRGRNPFG